MNRIPFSTKKMLRLALLVAVGAGLFAATTAEDDNRFYEISKNIEIFTTLYREVNTFYVDDVDPAKLMRKGIDAMVGSLDPYTNYISETEIEEYRINNTGNVGSIGATLISYNNGIVIAEPYEGLAANKAGLKAGDAILSIDGKPTQGKSVEDVTNILRGSPGSPVLLEVKSPDKDAPFKVTLQRDEIETPNVPYVGMVGENIGYIVLTTFTDRAGKNVEDALAKLKADHPNLKGVILDLRNNGGGLLSEAVNLSNVFINTNEEVVTTRGRVKEWDRMFKTLNAPADLNIPLAVLINKSSASASEIVAGVMQDLDRGVLVGQKSFGKGLVQNTLDIGYNSKVKVTIAKYYIPSGRCIQAVSYENGQPVEIADSLRSAFKTRNGRKVFDGGGVIPDVKTDAPDYGNITKSLLDQHLIFEYATQYVRTHPKPAVARDFRLTETEIADFQQFINNRKHTYQTESEAALQTLEAKAKAEKYYDAIAPQLAALRQQIATDKAKDFAKYKVEIADLLEREIASRYYFQKGRLEVGLRNDAEVQAAINLLNDPARYNRLLGK